MYLREVAKNPSAVSPPAVFEATAPPRDVEEVQRVLAELRDFKRHYFGLAYGDRRHIVAEGFPNKARLS